MADSTERTSNIVCLAQHLRRLHLTLGDRGAESEARATAALEAEVSHENAGSLADAAVQLMLAASTLQLIMEDLAGDRAADISRANRIVLSALRLLEKETPAELVDCGIDFFIGKGLRMEAVGGIESR